MNLETVFLEVLPAAVWTCGGAALLLGCVVVLFAMVAVMCGLVDAIIDRACFTLGISRDFIMFCARKRENERPMP